MKTYHCRSSIITIARLISIVCLVVFNPVIGADADPAKIDDNSAAALPIHITADNLSVDRTTNTAEFSGHVVAGQGDTQIKADRLKIHYVENASTQNTSSEEALEKIIASGNVEIKFDNRLAVTNEAVYITGEKVLILTGPETKITSGKDTISGEKITYYRQDGRVQVESGQQKRVEVTIFSSENGLN
ncbi:MAG: lipopolysaccharide transport periplasmic protein LptA [Desulfobacteraceae bacterium]|nr:lipopolysaccharide transport periplasmic protein LptA [Desulfobacteraceae bacterium]